MFSYLQEVQEVPHHIHLALSIADEGEAEKERSSQVAQNVQATVNCYAEYTCQRRGR